MNNSKLKTTLHSVVLSGLALVIANEKASADTLSITGSASDQQAVNLTYSNPTIVDNKLQVTVQIQNTSGTWVYIEQDLTFGPNAPVSLPYTVYLLGPGGTEIINNVAFSVNSYLKVNVTTPVGLDFTALNSKVWALYGAFSMDCMVRGLLTFPLPPDAFDQPLNGIGVATEPLLENVFQTLEVDGAPLGQLATDIHSRNLWSAALDVGQIGFKLASESDAIKNEAKQFLDNFTSDQVATLFNDAASGIGTIVEALDVPEKYVLLRDLTTATFGAPPTSWNRLDVIVTAVAPTISSVSPASFTGLPVGQTRLIRVIGSGFTGTSTLTFNDGFTSYPNRVPIFVSANELDYNITTGTSQANWTVQVVNAAQLSNLGRFTVNAPSSPPTTTGSLVVNLSPAGAISAGAQWQVDGTGYNGSGQVVGYLTPGSHTVSFKPISGYSTPPNQSVMIVANAQTLLSGTYSVVLPSTYALTLNQGGSIGFITPSPAGTWNGSAYIYNAGSVVQLTATANFGYHFANWGGNLGGTANPQTIVMDGNKTVGANFATGDPTLGTITVTLQPPEAVAAGLKWGFDTTDSRASDTSYSYYPNYVFLVYLHGASGWIGGGSVIIPSAGQTTNYILTASYTNGTIIGSDPRTYYTLAGSAGVQGSADGTNSSATFKSFQSLTVDTAGNIFAADNGNSNIRKVTPGGTVTTFAGQLGVTGYADGQGTNAIFNNIQGMAVDRSNNIYVADMINSVIRKITPDGTVSTFAGQAGSTGSTDGTGSAARFSNPIGVAVDTNGNIYVSDSANQTIRKITPGAVVTTLAGSAGHFGYADGTGTAALFHNPVGIAVDTSGNVYVADEVNEVIRKVTPSAVVSTLAGYPGSAGAADGSGSTARFQFLSNLAVDGAGNVYVADPGNNAIRMVTSAGVVTTLAGQSGNPGSTDGIGSVARFRGPFSVAVDGLGNLYVGDNGNHTIRATRPLTTKVDQLISFGEIPDKSASDAPFPISATSSSGLSVFLSVLSGPAVLDTNNLVTLLGGGVVNVIAWQPGNSNYNAAAPILRTFNVSRIPQTITFGPLSQQNAGDAPFSLFASADSGLPVSFSVSGPARLDGNILTLTDWGTVTVTASQPGNALYVPATNVVQSFLVIPPDKTIVAPQKLTNGNFQLAFYGSMGSNYLIQTSTNLINWQPFTNFAGTNGLMYLVDPTASNYTRRFYRAVIQ